jgi:hypothetical protein
LSKQTRNIKDLLGDSHSKDKAENCKTLDQRDVRVAERPKALAVMLVWLESNAEVAARIFRNRKVLFASEKW